VLQAQPMNEWVYGEWTLRGVTRAGIGTCFLLPSLDIAFDVAQGFLELARVSRFFITHGHMDHASGIPYLISQRALAHVTAPIFYMPESMVLPMKNIISNWEEIEGYKYQYYFHPIQVGEEVMLRADLLVRPFTAYHRIPALGYTLFRRKKRLKAEFKGLSGNRIRDLRKSGQQVEEFWEEPEISFSGDTKIDFFDKNEVVRKSRILVMEVTYLDERKGVDQARKWGHVHLDELIPRLSQFQGEKILITHLSARYSVSECERILDKRVPQNLRHKIEVFPQSRRGS